MNNKVNMKVKIAGVEFKNPVLTASGTCGFGREYLSYYSPSELGGIMVKGLHIHPKEGNKTPRVAETPAGMLNAIGLQNPGVDFFIKNELPELKKYDTVVIANIYGSNIDEYVEVARKLSAAEVDMLELNISCPNVKEGGIVFGTDESMVEKVTSEVKKASNKPLIVKLSPNVTDITKTALAAEAGGADALSMINTLIGMRIDIKTKRPVLKNNIGGLSGPAIKPVAVRMVWQAAQKVKIPIIGMGGISNADDALEFIMAGASAVAVGTASFANPYAAVEVISGLTKFCEKNEIANITDLRGSVKVWE